ncbi:MAG: response regulator [Chloroflexi bacterium]|nr:MAG: response regulator [Chloroflexota bacterium]
MSRVPCVIVAGESADGCRQIASMLRDEPWRIVNTADGKGVLDLVREHTADLILMDAHMIGLDGFEVTRRIRRDGGSRLLPVVLISGVNDIPNRVAALEAGADDFLSKPLERNELVARARSLLHLKAMRDQLEDARQVIFTLAKAAEAKDPFTLEHAERVADSASELARRVKLSPEVIQQIHVGALIHDVGKLAVPDQILNKPGPLTDEEFERVKTHTVVGAEIVLPLASQGHLVAIVRNHHERYDGRGYPDALAGEEIPFAARIVAVCDAYDAMVNQRPYRPAMPHPTAIRELLAGRERQWDAGLVDAFVAIQENR